MSIKSAIRSIPFNKWTISRNENCGYNEIIYDNIKIIENRIDTRLKFIYVENILVAAVGDGLFRQSWLSKYWNDVIEFHINKEQKNEA